MSVNLIVTDSYTSFKTKTIFFNCQFSLPQLITITIYDTGDDYYQALKYVFFYRDCLKKKLIRKLTTFHFFFPIDHIPKKGILNQVRELVFNENSQRFAFS
jgi:hypothetical protein